jgi:Xaa-Pro aminopeptidase
MNTERDLARDTERLGRVQEFLRQHGLDGLVCTLPVNVLQLSGYWPVVGNAVALASKAGRIALVVPEDEEHLARMGWADDIRTFNAGHCNTAQDTLNVVGGSLPEIAAAMGIGPGSAIGYEHGAMFEPAPYASQFVYGSSIRELIATGLPSVTAVDATHGLRHLRSALTGYELRIVREACRTAADAFQSAGIYAGMKEYELATAIRAQLNLGYRDGRRVDGYAFCMSGLNSVQAAAAFQLTRDRVLQAGDFALVHCNSYVGGFWTDITRTFCIGAPAERQRTMYEAVFAARQAACEAVRPGAKAADVDRAARDVLTARGFGANFRHATGHGVGYAAIDHNAPPRIREGSDETLVPGMVFNIEPAIYIDGYGGLRHCDMVAVTANGVEMLTPFQASIEELVVRK